MLERGRQRLEAKIEERRADEAKERNDRSAIGNMLGNAWAAVSEFARWQWSDNLAFLTLEIPGCTAIQARFQWLDGSWLWLHWGPADDSGVHIVATTEQHNRWQVWTGRQQRYGRLDEAVAAAREAFERGVR